MLNGLGFDEMLLLAFLALLFVKPQQIGQILKWVRTTRAKLANFQYDLEEKVDTYVQSNLDPKQPVKPKPNSIPNNTETLETKSGTTNELDQTNPGFSKEYFRKNARSKLATLDTEDLADFSEQIIDRLVPLQTWKAATVVAMFSPIQNEPQTNELLKMALEEGKEVYLPWVHQENNEIGLARVENTEELVEGAFGVLEPKEELRKHTNPGQIELFLVPGIAFGENGERLGRGKGFYDQLLKQHPKALKIALAFDFQIFKDSIPIEDHDIPMDILVTPQRLLKFGKKV